jgi:hypothetical protein
MWTSEGPNCEGPTCVICYYHNITGWRGTEGVCTSSVLIIEDLKIDVAIYSGPLVRYGSPIYLLYVY